MANEANIGIRKNQEFEEILTVTEVAEILKVPVSWIYEHTRPRCRYPLPCFKIGKYLRFSSRDIFSYVEFIRSNKMM
jgi:predicted DNA-binding transcriptional regulator AlpA